MSAYLSEPMKESRRFRRTIPDGLGFEGLVKKYPRGGEEFEKINNMMIFWEAVGSHLKPGLLNEELAFDTFLDAPPWPKAKRFFRERRGEHNPLEGENIEYVFNRSLHWRRRDCQVGDRRGKQASFFRQRCRLEGRRLRGSHEPSLLLKP